MTGRRGPLWLDSPPPASSRLRWRPPVAPGASGDRSEELSHGRGVVAGYAATPASGVNLWLGARDFVNYLAGDADDDGIVYGRRSPVALERGASA
ncbi:MAG TPA: hypothetical protein VNA27_09420 [Rubrobacteraceae bacterium]|nr:hypothetical protein [Rubrobacteraceae bacterium]